ncbi:hypothetical protein BC833DRAFT_617560 [Globomyces pollinis-pini]|nr:hypothetical protein BC833DRAFT_617560 [Globomyces pollinis-pini]
MVNIFGWLRKKEDIDYEKILETLDSDIRKTEVWIESKLIIEISSISIQQRVTLSFWTNYSSLAFLLYLLGYYFYYFYFQFESSDDWPELLVNTSLVILLPIFIYMGRRSVFIILQPDSYLIESLAELRNKQQLKVEELKKKTSYYMTKGLIERYATPTKDAPEAGLRQRNPGNIGKGQNTSKDCLLLNSELQQNELKPMLKEQHSNGSLSQSHPKDQLGVQTGSVSVSKVHLNKQNVSPVYLQPSHPQLDQPKTILDKFMDALIGDADTPQQRYALICEKCFQHNGLVLPDEYLDAKFICMSCKHLTIKKSSAKLLGVRRVKSHCNDYDTPTRERRLSNVSISSSFFGRDDLPEPTANSGSEQILSSPMIGSPAFDKVELPKSPQLPDVTEDDTTQSKNDNDDKASSKTEDEDHEDSKSDKE